jgi:NAD-dependent DNA ligase
MEEREHYYLIGLLAVSDIGNAHAKGLIDHFGSASHVFHAKSSELKEVPGISEKIIKNILDRHGLKASDEIMTQCQKNEIALISYRSKNIPIAYEVSTMALPCCIIRAANRSTQIESWRSWIPDKHPIMGNLSQKRLLKTVTYFKPPY